MKKLIILAFLFISTFSISQTFIKVNTFTTLLTIPNIGIETRVSDKFTFQFDITASFWKSIKGNPRQFYLFIPEWRYHFKELNKGFYVGAHIGASIYNFQKWNYLNTNMYEEGLGYVMGATLGYKTKINNRFSLDCFLGGGSSQGFYKGYFIGTKERYETAVKYNKSGEWLPYRGGVMLSYQL